MSSAATKDVIELEQGSGTPDKIDNGAKNKRKRVTLFVLLCFVAAFVGTAIFLARPWWTPKNPQSPASHSAPISPGESPQSTPSESSPGTPTEATAEPSTSGTTPRPTSSPTKDRLQTLSKLQSELDAAKALWSERNIQTYNFSYKRVCFCLEDCFRDKLVQVVDGSVVAINDKSPIQDNYHEPCTHVPTLDELFSVIQDAIDFGAVRLDVEYDSGYGYPTWIDIDHEEEMVDDEISYSAKLEEIY